MNRTRMCWVGLTAATMMLLACASNTELVNVWADPKYAGPPFGNILVVGISDVITERNTFEDSFAGQLKTRGVNAVASHTLLPSPGEIDKDKLVEAIEGSDIDGVLATRLISIDTKTQYVSGYATAVPSIGYYDDFYGFYHSAWVDQPPTIREYEVVTLETSLFQVKEQALVWSGTTETFAPGAGNEDITRLADIIINALAEKGLIRSDAPAQAPKTGQRQSVERDHS